MSETIKPGRYRHFKGKEYEVLYIATHSETCEEWWSIARCMVNAACGCAPQACGMRSSSAMERRIDASPTSARATRDA